MHVELVGLDNIDIDPQIFHPFERNGFRSQVIEENAICTTPPLTEDTVQAIKQRLRKIQPQGNLLDIMKWTANKSGQQNLSHAFNSDFTNDNDASLFGISSDGKHFTGVWNLIKYIAQSIIYSRASGIDEHDFFTNVTVEEYYNIMAWVHWSRDVMYVKNDEAAAEGGVVMAKILQALSSRSSSSYDEEYDATFIIGHDGDLNAVATALGSLGHCHHPTVQDTYPLLQDLHFTLPMMEMKLSYHSSRQFSLLIIQ